MSDIFEKEHELLHFLYQNTNLQAICNKMEELTGTPIGVGDFYWNKVVMSRNFSKDDLSDMINRIEHLPLQQRERSMEKMLQWLSDGKPRLIELPYLRNCRMVCGIFYQKHLLAYLEAPDMGSAFDELNLELFQACADIMGLALHLNHFPTSQVDRQPLMLLWNHFNHTVTEKYIESWDHCPEFCFVKSFTMLWTDHSVMKETLTQALGCLEIPYWSLDFSDGVLCLAGIGEERLSALYETAVKLGAHFGISDSFTDLNTSLDESLRQAKLAYMLSNYSDRKGPAVYNNYKIQDMLCQASPYLDLTQFHCNTLSRLRAWDQEHMTEYELTLKTYLLCGKNLTVTAKQLFIHKNTVIYRINKLREYFGIDFEDCGQISHLYCSFLIDEMQ